MDNKKKLIIPVVLLLLIIVLTTSYAWLVTTINSTKINRIKVGNLDLDLVLDDNLSNGIDLEIAVPESDEDVLKHEAYSFAVENRGTVNAEYVVYLEDEEIEGTRLEDENIRYSITKNGSEENPQDLITTIKEGKRELDRIIIDSGKTNEYTLKLWISQEAGRDIANKIFKAKIKIEALETENSSMDTYKLDGYLYDNNDNIVTNGLIVSYSNPIYTRTNNEGKFSISGLEYGEHTLYYVEGKEQEEIQELNKKEIESLSNVGKVNITTGSKLPITLDNGYIIKEGSISKEKKYQLTYDYNTNGGTKDNETTMVLEKTKADLTKTGERSGYTFVGWNTDKNAHEGLEEVEINETTILYAIYSKPGETYTVTFNKNATTGETTTESCTIEEVYNNEEQDTSCNITSPTITVASGYNKVGYNKSSTGTTSTWNEGAEKAISSNETYYAIQSKTVTITFTKGSNTSSIGSTTLSCTMYNNETCSITMPSITAASGYAATGWQVSSGTLDTSLSTEPTYYTTNTQYAIKKNSSSSITMKAICKETYVYDNSHIKAAYTYNQDGTGTGLNYTGCLGGEEKGCNKISIKTTDTVPTGTIIKYEVKPGVEKYFNVLYDNGDTLTMQQREKTTTYGVGWYGNYATSPDNKKGPTTVLAAIESSTEDWEYVNDQTYTFGSTVFGTGSYATAKTHCSATKSSVMNANQCKQSKTLYTNTHANVKARIIAATEAGQMGCLIQQEGSAGMSCMKFMNNYSNNSLNYGGTVNDNSTLNGSNYIGNYGYWTITGSNESGEAFAVFYHGGLISTAVNNNKSITARAVVVVNK